MIAPSSSALVDILEDADAFRDDSPGLRRAGDVRRRPVRARADRSGAWQAARAAAGGMFVSLNGALTPRRQRRRKIRLAAKTGYGGVDWDLGPAKTAGLDATKALFAELKIKPTITNLPMARPLPFAGEDGRLPGGAQAARRRRRVRAGDRLQEDDAGAAGDRRRRRRTSIARSCVERLSAVVGGAAEIEPAPRARVPRPARTCARARAATASRATRSSGRCRRPWRSPRTAAPTWARPRRVALASLRRHRPATSSPPATSASSTCTSPTRSRRRRRRCATTSASCRAKAASTWSASSRRSKKIGYADGVSPEPLGRVPAGDVGRRRRAKLGLETTLAVMKKAGVA